MPSIWKYLSSPKAELSKFPNTDEMIPDQPEELQEPEWVDEAPPVPAEEKEEPLNPVSFAQLQADSIVQDAKQQAEEILARARKEAEREAQEIREAAKREGFDQGLAEGLTSGMAQAMEETARIQNEKAEALAEDVQRFLEKAAARLDRQLDENVLELRDLAIAIAEKIVCVSLKSSESVIGKMIQTAVDKRKRREWAHIYIAESDVKRLTPIPASLSATLVALSDRVRIIPVADDEPGTCIIEMPDEIIDASASTQMNNLRTMLYDTPLPNKMNFNHKGSL